MEGALQITGKEAKAIPKYQSKSCGHPGEVGRSRAASPAAPSPDPPQPGRRTPTCRSPAPSQRWGFVRGLGHWPPRAASPALSPGPQRCVARDQATAGQQGPATGPGAWGHQLRRGRQARALSVPSRAPRGGQGAAAGAGAPQHWGHRSPPALGTQEPTSTGDASPPPRTCKAHGPPGPATFTSPITKVVKAKKRKHKNLCRQLRLPRGCNKRAGCFCRLPVLLRSSLLGRAFAVTAGGPATATT